MSENKDEARDKAQKVSPRVEEFICAIEQKTNDDIHHRILRACRSHDPTESMETELNKIIEEILHET